MVPLVLAFCGFYVGGAGQKLLNGATEVVLMRSGTTTVLSMENNYQGPPDKFAMIVPVPVVVKENQVKTLPRELFDKVDTLGAPRLVEYWEDDPCHPTRMYDPPMMLEDAVEAESDGPREKREEDYHVKIEAKFSVGEYDVVVLSASESTGLDHWLHANHYEIPDGAEPLLRPYVEQGTKFFVAKVDPKKVHFENGMATLSPLRFYYDSPDFSLPIRLGVASSPGTQDLIVNIVAPNNTRYEVANRKNVTIPTNIVVKDEVRDRFGEFYAALFDHAIGDVPDAVVTEYSWDTGNCDPCPGPVLDANDLATLGADILDKTYSYHGGGNYTLTRLHTRYGKDIKDDLVFRSVEPIEGGRGIPGPKGELSSEVTRTGSNNFQGRYVMLHPWTGEVACEKPQRGLWGGPPQARQQIATQAASNLAFAPRGKVELASMLVDGVPKTGLIDSKGTTLPLPVRKTSGCACDAGDATSGAVGMLGMLGVLGLVTRKRRDRLAE